MKYGYARVSTTGQSLEAQEAELNNAGCDIIYKEKYMDWYNEGARAVHRINGENRRRGYACNN